MADPKYVRLPERLLSGNVTDVLGGSQWGISGLDVKEFPSKEDDPEAYAFVRDCVRANMLEEASADEYRMVRKAVDAVEEAAAKALPTNQGGPAQPSPWNEAAIANVANKHRKKLVAARVADSFEQAAEEDSGSGSDSAVDYTSLNHTELQDEARKRGLDSSGTKKEIAARLEEDDQAKASA